MAKPRQYLDPDQLLGEILDSDFDLSRFEEIDDSDFKKPPNFFECIIGREFCDATLLPWQVEAGMKLFSDYCPDCSNPVYLNNLYDQSIGQIQDNIKFLEHGVCLKCKKNRLELFEIPKVGQTRTERPALKKEAVINAGQRSGKTKLVVAATCYQLMRWLKLPNPIAYYNLGKMDIVIGTFSALTDDQAYKNLWLPFMGLYDNAPWFKKYNDFLQEEQKRLGTPLVQKAGTFLFYRHKRIRYEYTGSKDANTKRGATRLFGAIDEIAFLSAAQAQGGKKNKAMDADDNYAALNNSLATLRVKASNRIEAMKDPDVMTAIMYNASSPLNAQDKIMQLTQDSVTNPSTVCLHRATWELNPEFTLDSCRLINPGISETAFWRDFGAMPPFSDSPYIDDAKLLERLCVLDASPNLQISKQIYTDPLGERFFHLEAKITQPDLVTPRLMALDNGYSNNAFSCAIFRYDPKTRKTMVDSIVSCSPDPDQKTRIHFPKMFEEFILKIVKSYNIRHVFYDRWQSIDQIQRLRGYKINAQAYSLNYERDFLPFKQSIITGNVLLPKLEIPIQDIKNSSNPLKTALGYPIANLLWQILTVREAGRKIHKPLLGDDDMFRAFVLGGSRFLDEAISNQYSVLGGVLAGMPGADFYYRSGTYSGGRSGTNIQSNPSTQDPQRFHSAGYARKRR